MFFEWLFHGRIIRFARRPDFYETREWLELRYRVLCAYGARCMLCRRTRNDKDLNGRFIKMHVDHIKPRSKFPWLALSFKNMQVLCADCNRGKSNKYLDDWR